MLRNGILRVCFYFCPEFRVVFSSADGSEQNSMCLLLFLFYGTDFWVVFSSAEWFRTEFPESLLLFLFHGTEFRAFFSSTEQFGTDFRKFSVPRNSRNSAGTNQLFRLFRLPQNNFLSEIANLLLMICRDGGGRRIQFCFKTVMNIDLGSQSTIVRL